MIFEMSLFEFESLVQPMLIMASSDNLVLVRNFDAGIMQFMPRVIHDVICDLFVGVVGNCCIICTILFPMIC